MTAENPSDGFRPTSGAIHSLDFHPPERVWGYFSVGSKGAVHPYADSQFGHIFAGGATRNEARKRLIWGLQQLHIRGDIRTPVKFLQLLLQQPAFVNHTLNTEWLDGIIKAKELLPSPRASDVVFCAAAFRAIKALQVSRDRQRQRDRKICCCSCCCCCCCCSCCCWVVAGVGWRLGFYHSSFVFLVDLLSLPFSLSPFLFAAEGRGLLAVYSSQRTCVSAFGGPFAFGRDANSLGWRAL